MTYFISYDRLESVSVCQHFRNAGMCMLCVCVSFEFNSSMMYTLFFWNGANLEC